MIRGNHTIKSLTGTGGTLQLDNTSAVGLATSGNVLLSSGVNVVVELANGSGNPVSRGLTVGGLINLGNATLTPNAIFNGTPPPGTSLVVINKTSAGVVTGTFNNLPEGSLLTISGSVFRLTYVGGDGNDVVLHVPATRTWDGGGATNNWTEAANWVGDAAPSAGDSLVFPAGAARLSNSNNFAAGTSFNSITLSGTGYSLSGNAIALTGGVTENVLSGTNNTISIPITLNASQSFLSTGPSGRTLNFVSVNTNGKLLTLDGSGPINFGGGGSISGTGAVTRTGTGLSVFVNANSYTGATTVNGGTLRIDNNQPASAVLLSGGVLSGNGVLGPLTATGGTVSPGGGSGVPTLTVSGNAVLSPSTTFVAESILVGLTTFVGQVSVNGAINLNGSTLSAQFDAVPSTATSILINNNGADPIVGTFAGLSEGAIVSSNSRLFRLSYVGGDGNDVTLTSVSGTLAFTNSSYSVSEAGVTATITLSRTGGGDTTAVAKVTLADVSTSPADYRFSPGRLDTTFNSAAGPNDRVNAIAIRTDGKFIIGGDFSTYDGISRSRIARLNIDGSLDNSFNPGSGTNPFSFVETIAEQLDSKIIIGGSFNTFDGTPRNNIARL